MKIANFVKKVLWHVWNIIRLMILMMSGKMKKMLGSSIEDMTANTRHITLDELDELIPEEEV